MTAAANQVVIDASAAVALVADFGDMGWWAASSVQGCSLAAPDLMPYEAANILRRHALAGLLDESVATLAERDLAALDVELCPYSALARRTWELRGNLTVYDAAYVALAELLDAPFMTLDARISRVVGPRCQVLAYAPV